MDYMPVIKSARPRQQFQIGQYTAVLLGDIERGGVIEYKYIMVVFGERQEPCFFVASEVNELAGSNGGGSHFLGFFDDNGHANCGASDDWADEAKFTEQALRMVRERFGVAT